MHLPELISDLAMILLTGGIVTLINQPLVLGLQRENLPLAQPDVNMVMLSGDLVWILGTRSMADKVLKA